MSSTTTCQSQLQYSQQAALPFCLVAVYVPGYCQTKIDELSKLAYLVNTVDVANTPTVYVDRA